MSAWIIWVAIVASAAASVLGLSERTRRWVGPLVLAQLTYLLVMAVGGIFSAGPGLFLRLSAGSLVYALTPWTAAWLALAELFIGLATAVLWTRHEGPGLFAGLAWLGTATAGFLMAGTPLALLLAWGVMALGAYVLVVSQARGRRTVEAGWVMLAMSEVGTAALLLGAVLLSDGRPPAEPWLGVAAALGIIGLGAKAGLFPFQVWLPLAEPEAPGAAAGVLSGVLSTVVLVGLWHWLTWAPPPTAIGWGAVVVGLGGALLGVIHAIIDPDFKRVLAYSTVEWVGLAIALLGLTVVFISRHLLVAASLTQAAYFALLLMHLGAKTAAFTSAGWVERTVGTRRFTGVGGLFRASGALGKWLVLAAVALMAIPPTGGYLAEWSALEGLFVGASSPLRVHLIIAAIVVALIGAGGATAILRWYGMLFLGPVRRPGKVAPAVAEVWLVGVGAVVAWAAGLGVGWWAPQMEARAPVLLGHRLGGLVAPTFTHPASTTLLNTLGGRIFTGMPGTPGVVLFPGPGFTATSPWDLAWFAAGLVGLIYVVRWAWRRHVGYATVRTEPPWVGSIRHQAGHTWSAAGLTHPLRVAFAPIVGMQRQWRTHKTRGLIVETDAVDRLIVHGFRPALQSLSQLTSWVQQLQTGDLSDYVGYAVMALLAGLVCLHLLGV